MKHIFKILFFALLIGVIWVFTTLIQSQLNRTKDISEEIDETYSIVNEVTAATIIRQVETAYETAYLKNSSYPTLEQVMMNFSCKNVIWQSNDIIEAKNFNCSVEVIDNNLKVNCLNHETKNQLIIG